MYALARHLKLQGRMKRTEQVIGWEAEDEVHDHIEEEDDALQTWRDGVGPWYGLSLVFSERRREDKSLANADPPASFT